jgi:phosphatidate cytidylyltransferase
MKIAPHILWAMAGIFSLLTLASAILWLLRNKLSEGQFAELKARIKTWWTMAFIFSASIAVSPKVSLVLFAFVSFVALKEYFTLIPTRRADRRVLFLAYMAIPLQYLWISMGWYGMFIIFIPVYMFLLLPARMVLIGETEGFLRSVGTIHWGLMMTVFSVSHVTFFIALPPKDNPAGGAGLVLYLVILTQLNDVAQYMWGKSFGKRKIIPKVSPNKTWEGFVGGLVTTAALAMGLAPLLTPLSHWLAMAAGPMIGVAGFLGDVTISALKRDLRIKDSGSLLPGHGGILDRIDSLTYTAPLFFHFTYYFCY